MGVTPGHHPTRHPPRSRHPVRRATLDDVTTSNPEAAAPHTFTCPACDGLTRHPSDVAERYCPRCHWWTGNPQLAWARPDLYLAHGKRPPDEPDATPRGIRGYSADTVIRDEITAFMSDQPVADGRPDEK